MLLYNEKSNEKIWGPYENSIFEARGSWSLFKPGLNKHIFWKYYIFFCIDLYTVQTFIIFCCDYPGSDLVYSQSHNNTLMNFSIRVISVWLCNFLSIFRLWSKYAPYKFLSSLVERNSLKSVSRRLSRLLFTSIRLNPCMHLSPVSCVPDVSLFLFRFRSKFYIHIKATVHTNVSTNLFSTLCTRLSTRELFSFFY